MLRVVIITVAIICFATRTAAANIKLAGNTISAKFSVELFACRKNVCDRNVLSDSILMYLSPTGAVFDYSNGQSGTILQPGKWNRIGEHGATEIKVEYSGARFSLDSRAAD